MFDGKAEYSVSDTSDEKVNCMITMTFDEYWDAVDNDTVPDCYIEIVPNDSEGETEND